MSEHTHTPELVAELLEALETAMKWIKNWDVAFLDNYEWPEDEAKIKAAIARARGEG